MKNKVDIYIAGYGGGKIPGGIGILAIKEGHMVYQGGKHLGYISGDAVDEINDHVMHFLSTEGRDLGIYDDDSEIIIHAHARDESVHTPFIMLGGDLEDLELSVDEDALVIARMLAERAAMQLLSLDPYVCLSTR